MANNNRTWYMGVNAMMNPLDSKKSQGLLLGPELAFFIIIIAVFLFAGTGVIKFLISDKTPYIIAGVFFMLILMRRRN